MTNLLDALIRRMLGKGKSDTNTGLQTTSVRQTMRGRLGRQDLITFRPLTPQQQGQLKKLHSELGQKKKKLDSARQHVGKLKQEKQNVMRKIRHMSR